MRKMNNIKLTISFLLISTLLVSSQAQDIFSWTDKDGKVHYSNEAKDLDAKSVELPNTERYNSDQRIKDYKKETARTCLNKGGIQCSLGADTDGSVICSDNSKDSEESFEASCSEVKLLADLKKTKKRLSKQLLRIPLDATVRNQSSQEAIGVDVKVKLPKTPNADEFFDLKLEGPTTIPAFGVAEYSYSGKLFDDRIVIKGVISVDCDNCLKAKTMEHSKEIPLEFRP